MEPPVAQGTFWTVKPSGLLLGAVVLEGAEISMSGCGTLQVPSVWEAERDVKEL